MIERNRIVTFGGEDFERRVRYLFESAAGVTGSEPKKARLREDGYAVRDRLFSYTEPRAVISYYDDVKVNGKNAYIGGVCFECMAFQQIEPAVVNGAWVYAVTAGEEEAGGDGIMDQLYAHIWGTAYMDAAREELRKLLSEGAEISDDFAPGFYGMPLGQMREICRLVDTGSIGVRAADNGTLRPARSCAGIYFEVSSGYRRISGACADCLGSSVGCSLCRAGRGGKKNR